MQISGNRMKMQMMTAGCHGVVFAVGLLACSVVIGGGVPFPEALDDANVSVSSMADGQSESLIVGNGDLYGIVWERDGVLTIRVTKNDIWDARVDTSKDGPLPKVDIATGKVTGSTGAPPSYGKPYPQPRCAAALRLGGTEDKQGTSWVCVRGAGQHGFASGTGTPGGVMNVAGSEGASTGYSATLVVPVETSSVRLKLKGTPNASYYVNLYNKGGKAVLESGWKQSPTEMTEVDLPFPASSVARVEVYTMSSDGKRAENRVEALHLGEVPIKVSPPVPAAQGSLDLRRGVVTVEQSGQADTTIRVLPDRNVVLIRGPGAVIPEPISATTLPDAKTGETFGVAWLHMEMPGDLDYAGMSYALAVAGRGDLKAVSLVTSFDIEGGSVLDLAISLARNTLGEKESALVAKHEKWSA